MMISYPIKSAGLIVVALAVAASARNSSADTLNFALEVDGVSTGALVTADGADIEIEAIEFREGTDPSQIHYVPGTSRFTPLVVTYNRDQNQTQQMFHQGMQQWVEATRNPSPIPTFRRDISLVTLAPDNSELERANLSDAFPIFFSPITPDLAETERIYELHVVFENMQVSSVPEPSTLLLMMVGALLLIHRRKPNRQR